MKKGTMIILGSIAVMILGVRLATEKVCDETFCQVLTFTAMFVGIPFGIHSTRKENKARYEALSPAARARIDEQKAVKLREAQEKREQWVEDHTIVSTAIVDTTQKSKTKASATSSVVRGAVGGALFGPVGLVAGAVTPKKKTVTKNKEVTFAIRYASGRCETEVVKAGSSRFNELAKYIA